MNANDFHPFWKGVFHEFGKQSDLAALPGQAAELATSSPGAAAAVGGAGILGSIGAIALKRRLFRGKAAPKKRAKPEPAAEPPPPAGFSGKALLGTGAAAGAAGYYYGQKKD